jgi:hypothetical protein
LNPATAACHLVACRDACACSLLSNLSTSQKKFVGCIRFVTRSSVFTPWFFSMRQRNEPVDLTEVLCGVSASTTDGHAGALALAVPSNFMNSGLSGVAAVAGPWGRPAAA